MNRKLPAVLVCLRLEVDDRQISFSNSFAAGTAEEAVRLAEEYARQCLQSLKTSASTST